MWFKNILVYRFTKPFQLSAEELEVLLAEQAFQPCSSHDTSRYGWVTPLGRHGTEFVHVNNTCVMICAKRQDKVLPAAVINESIEEKILEIETKEGRKVGSKERQAIKEEIIYTLLPKAFTRSSLHFAYIAPLEGLIVVNASSANRAEELLTKLRETIGSLAIIPIAPKNLAQEVMTTWLRQGVGPKGFELGHQCELRDALDASSVIRCKHQVLSSEEIKNHIEAGMQVIKVGLCSDSGIECVIDDKLAVKGLRYGDIIQEKVNECEAQDVVEQFDIDFSIMTLELSVLIQLLLKALGGEDLSAVEAQASASEADNNGPVIERVAVAEIEEESSLLALEN